MTSPPGQSTTRSTRTTRPRLAILASHPIQYQAPLFRAIAESGRVDLEVLFESTFGVEATYDPGFGRSVRWDIPLTDGYDHRFLPRLGPVDQIDPPFGHVNPSVLQHVRSGRYDAVMVQGYAQVSDWIAFASLAGTGVRLLLRGETPEPPLAARTTFRGRLKRRLLAPVVQGSDACLAIGLRNARFYFGMGASREQVVWSPYSVDNELFARGGAEGRRLRTERLEELQLDPALPVVLFAAKLMPRKRVLDVIAAMDRLDGSASLLVIGDGEQRDAVAAKTADRPWMRAIGFVNQRELATWYGVADVYVLPSDHETWGLTINEAMAAGAVPIASDVVGCAPDLVAGGAGRVFPVGDVTALGEAIASVLEPASLAAARAESAARIERYGLGATVAGIEFATCR